MAKSFKHQKGHGSTYQVKDIPEKKPSINRELIAQQLTRETQAPTLEFLNKKQQELWLQLLLSKDINENSTLFTLKLTEDMNDWEVSRTLYDNGMLMVFRDSQGEPVYTPVVVTRWGYNKLPVACRPYTYFGVPTIDTAKEYVVGIDCVLLYDGVCDFDQSNKPISRRTKTHIILSQLAEVFARLNINITMSGNKLIVLAETQEMHDSIRETLYNAFSSNSPFAIFNKPLATAPLNEQFEPQYLDLWQLIQSYEQYRQLVHGFGGGQFGGELSTKDRLVVAETQANNDSVDLIYQARLKSIQHFIKQAKKVLDLDVIFEENKPEPEKEQAQDEAQSDEDKPQDNEPKGEKA